MTTLLLFPLGLESKFFLRRYRELGADVEEIEFGRLKGFEQSGPAQGTNFFFISGHGKVQSGVQAQYLVDHAPKKIENIVMIGAGGLLNTELRSPSLCIGRSTIEHDYKERFSPNARSPKFTSAKCLANKFESSKFYKENSFSNQGRIFKGQIASGDEDIVSEKRRKELFEETGADVVAWEGAGAARVAKFNDINFLEIRALTDVANESAAKDFKTNLENSMKLAAELTHSAFC